MMKTAFVVGALLSTASLANAGGTANTFGVGVEAQINGTGGLSGTYDAGAFHFGGFLGIQDPAGANNTAYQLGARFFYHVHSTATSDFGIGGSIGLDSVPVADGMGRTTRNNDVFLEPSFQIRVFLSANVALSFTGGIVIGAADTDGVSLTGQTTGGVAAAGGVGSFGVNLMGGAGVHYYFN